MEPYPPAYIQLRLPRGEHLWYHPTNTDVPELVREIRAQRYTVWFFDINVVGLQRQRLPRAKWLQAVVLGRFIRFIAFPPVVTRRRVGEARGTLIVLRDRCQNGAATLPASIRTTSTQTRQTWADPGNIRFGERREVAPVQRIQ